jgi:hypothetical protein
LEQHEAALRSRKNVVGLGIVPIDDAVRDPGGTTLAVAVYVEKKVPLDQLAEEDIVPKILDVGGRGGTVQVRTKVIEQGPIELEGLE